MRIFKVSPWDAIPAALTFIHLGAVAAFFVCWPHMSWAARIGCAALYGISVGWSLNSLAHNFIHNRFFAWEPLNVAVSFAMSWTLATPQTMYRYIHLRHHAGNADRPGPDGKTIDPLSIYQHGHDGKAEPMLSYVFLQFFRDDSPFDLAKRIGAKRPKEARQAMAEFWSMLAIYGVMLLIHWPFILLLAPFNYLGQCLSNLSGYYEHLGGNPDKPIAWGVSTYERVYNWTFLYNGYHAEHHYRPKVHWSKMVALRRQIAGEQKAAGVTVIGPAHPLGFLDPKTWSVPRARRPRAAAVVEV